MKTFEDWTGNVEIHVGMNLSGLLFNNRYYVMSRYPHRFGPHNFGFMGEL